MIDTVKFFHPHELTATPFPPNCKVSNFEVSGEHHLGRGKNFKLYDPESGFNAYGGDGYFKYFSASLPRLLYKTNGRLIKDQTELDAALDLLRQNAAQIGDPLICESHFTRVDLVWQFRVDVEAFMRAHRESPHSRIRSGSIRYGKRSLVWEGSGVRISFYDKILEEFKRNGDILRVEIQLHGDRLKEELGKGERVRLLNFDLCYQAYRRTMLGFQLPPLPRLSKISELLALGEMEGWTAGGSSPFEIYTARMSAGSVRRLKREMTAIRSRVHQIDWAVLLPENGPPPAIEIEDP